MSFLYYHPESESLFWSAERTEGDGLLVALADIDPADPRRRAYEDAAYAAREARARAAGVGVVPNAKRQHGEDVARATAEGWEREQRARRTK